MKEKIQKIIETALKEMAEDASIEGLENPNAETRLYGEKSPLDSMNLVNLIADLEERIADEFGKDIVLADERTMSLRDSPFRRVASLVEHIALQLHEQEPK